MKLFKTKINANHARQRTIKSFHHFPLLITSTPRCAFTNSTTWARSRFRATKPLFPCFPNNISGFTTNLVEESHVLFMICKLPFTKPNRMLTILWFPLVPSTLNDVKQKSVLVHMFISTLNFLSFFIRMMQTSSETETPWSTLRLVMYPLRN